MQDIVTASNIVNCARCGGSHAPIVFRRLRQPVVDNDGKQWTHWAGCPTNGEPLLMIPGELRSIEEIEVNLRRRGELLPRGASLLSRLRSLFRQKQPASNRGTNG